MSEHTAGPWTAAKARTPTDGEYDFAVGAMIEGKKYCIAEAFGRVSEGHRTPAAENARLIAAAPDMLAALRGAMTVIDSFVSTDVPGVMQRRAAILAAIAKATGTP